MNDCHPEQEQPKVQRLERLYHEAGRDDAQHPMHGLFTGLHVEELRERAARLNPEPAA